MIETVTNKRLRFHVSCICLLSLAAGSCAYRVGAEECDQPAQVKVASDRTICASEAPELISAEVAADKAIVGSLQRQDKGAASPTGTFALLARVHDLKLRKLRLKLALARRAGETLLHHSPAVR